MRRPTEGLSRAALPRSPQMRGAPRGCALRETLHASSCRPHGYCGGLPIPCDDPPRVCRAPHCRDPRKSAGPLAGVLCAKPSMLQDAGHTVTAGDYPFLNASPQRARVFCIITNEIWGVSCAFCPNPRRRYSYLYLRRSLASPAYNSVHEILAHEIGTWRIQHRRFGAGYPK
jgi:hypothetical protein